MTNDWHNMAAQRQERCLFLDMIPPELRLMVYEHLLVEDQVVSAPPHESSPKRHLELSILRVNRQIHDEAAAVFYSKNTIRVRPLDEDERHSSPTSTIAPRYHHLVRSLSIEILHCPKAPSLGWARTHDQGANPKVENHKVSGYLTFLTSLLGHTCNLHNLTLTITPPPQPSSKQILTALLPLQDSCLPSIVSSLPLQTPPSLSFEFDDCYYRTRVDPAFLRENGVLLMACKVLFWKSHLRIEKAIKEAEGENGAAKLSGKGGMTDLTNLVGGGVEALMERGRQVEGLMG